MEKFDQNRRSFLKAAAGIAAMSVLPVSIAAGETAAPEAPAYPWTYFPVDKDKVREACYKAFSAYGGCAAGCIGGILDVMAAESGYPYNQIPPQMFANGAAGYGYGGLCGSLGGACAVLGLFCTAQDARALRDQLYAYYKAESFPVYQPELESISTVSGDINCSVSVGTYMAAAGITEMSDPRRIARCAGVTADVGAKTIELLNILYGYEEAPAEEPAAEPAAAANEYIGTAVSEIGGEVKVKVTMDGDKIAKIDVLSHNETVGISDPAFAQIPDAIVAANSTAIDTVSGATKTSEALIAAVNDALSQIK